MVNAQDSLSDISGNVGSITITGNITHAILDIGNNTQDAKVGSFTASGDWSASTLSVGITRAQGIGGTDSLFGTSDDRPIGGNSSVGSLTIGGHIVAGSNGQNYGIEGGSFGQVTIDGVDRSVEFSTLDAYTPLALTDVPGAAGGGVFAVRVIAPNGLVNHTLTSASVVSYHEADGDLVTVKFSKALFTGPNADDLDSVFSFNSDTGSIQSIDFNGLYNSDVANGIGMTFTVTKVGSSDGLAGDVQSIYADRTLGAIKGIGNLDSIVISNHQQEALALKSLSVRSMVWDHVGDIQSEISGNVGSVTINGGFSDLRFIVDGSLQALSVTGDISGGDNDHTGFSVGSVKTISVGNITGSAKDASASIAVDGDVGTLMAGDIRGNAGAYSGTIAVSGTVNTAKLGTLTGGNGDYSGVFLANKSGSITGGDLTGGGGKASGSVLVAGAAITTQLGSLTGGTGQYSGIFGGTKAGSITTGDITGGMGQYSGAVAFDGKVTTAKVGAVTGGDGDDSGIFYANVASSITTGDLTGGVGMKSGSIGFDDKVTTAKVGAITGGDGESSGAVYAKDAGTITATSVTTGTGDFAGEIFIDNPDAETDVTVTGNLNGTGSTHPTVVSSGNIETLTIGGAVTNSSLVAKNFGDITITGAVTATQKDTGIFATNTIKSLTAPSLEGDSVDHQLNIGAAGDAGDGYTKKNVAIGSITISGDIAHTAMSAGYRAGVDNARVTSVSVGGDWIASTLDVGIDVGPDDKYYTADDALKGVSHLGSLTIKGNIIGSNATGDYNGIRAGVFDKLVFGGTTVSALTYPIDTAVVISAIGGGTLGNGAVFIERGQPLPPA